VVDNDPIDCFSLSSNFIEVVRVDAGPPCTGINRPENEIVVNISPNPAFEYLNYNLLKAPGNEATILIFNAFGEKLIETKINMEDQFAGQIDISQIPNGVQFFTVVVDNKIITKKFLVLDK